MNDNNIGNRGIELLGDSLLDARHLRKLGLSKCGIAATGGVSEWTNTLVPFPNDEC